MISCMVLMAVDKSRNDFRSIMSSARLPRYSIQQWRQFKTFSEGALNGIGLWWQGWYQLSKVIFLGANLVRKG